MDNYKIADTFSLLSKLMDIHGENSFKSKSYASASFAIENLSVQLSEIPTEKISSLKGIGDSSAKKIVELLENEELKILEDLIKNTPPGVLEMLNIKGIGPKKIHTIWKEMEVETPGELLYACKENRLKLFKGFGEKTQQNVIDSIEFYFKNKGSHLYATVALVVPVVLGFIKRIFPENKIAITGNFKRQDEIINALEFLIDTSENNIEDLMHSVVGFTLKERSENTFLYTTDLGINVKLYSCLSSRFAEMLIQTSSSDSFNTAFQSFLRKPMNDITDETAYFKAAGIQFIPACLRENAEIIEIAKNDAIPAIIQSNDIKGIIHCHSNWSDGSNTIEQMATAAIERGLEYLVLSDHSKSAFYAQGLSEEKIREQHLYIDELNEKLKPFKIFKSIESDILNDGNLDYSNNVLATFDLVIASVHSNLKMSEEKAMMRLLKAIENPYTTILGHMTGRLLLSRPGYPVDHKKIIDACALQQVVIELNANPSRLDIDWRFIPYALEKNVLISINPDAHHTDGLDDTNYAVLCAQKAFLPKEKNLSSFSLIEFEEYINKRKKTKQI